MKHLRPWLVALGAFLGLAHAAEVSVAVAANFASPMQKIVQLFQQDTGHKAVLSLGSTGNLYAQIRNGAPFEVFLSADDETPKRIEQEGLAATGSRFTYATGRLVLWSKKPGLVDEQGDVLKSDQFQRLALANPKLAPYGTAAWETLTRLGLVQGLRGRLVQGDNIAQTYQFVSTENAQLGFVALSQVMQDGKISTGSAWLVPAALHEPIRQDAVLLQQGANNPAAKALLQYLRTDAARAVIRAYGYSV